MPSEEFGSRKAQWDEEKRLRKLALQKKRELAVGETEIVKPELAIEINKDGLASLAERFPEQREMLERFAKLPPIELKRRKVNYIFGPNGSGKSTLANAIFLATQIAHETQRRIVLNKETRETAEQEAHKNNLNPARFERFAFEQIVSMALAPRLVEAGAIKISKFQTRLGFGAEENLDNDKPIVVRIAVQDILGKEKSEEMAHRHEDRRSGFGLVSSGGNEKASSRQTLEKQLAREFKTISPGSIVMIDEASFGLSPKRQQEYIETLERLAAEKDLIIIAPENSGYAYDISSSRIDLNVPEEGLHLSENRDSETRVRVKPVEVQEGLPDSTIRFAIDREKIKGLVEKNPKFAPMLETFAQLPETIGFEAGKTEIFADNGGGKTTLLGALFLLLNNERMIKEYADPKKDVAEERKRRTEYTFSPSDLNDRLFLESLGFARELIVSGAITLANVPEIPKNNSTMDGVTSVTWVNLLDIAGGIMYDRSEFIKYAVNEDVERVATRFQKMRPNQKHGSTRQSAEDMLLRIVENMPEGGYLFVDEIDGGVSPDRQLTVSDQVNKAAKTRGITIISTSNSYEGYKFRLTPSLDLSEPNQGIVPPTHRLV